MPFVKLEKLLPKSVKKAGIQSQLDSAKILESFNQVIEKFFGPAAAKKIRPLSLNNGSLSIACLSSVLAQRLKSQERMILEAVNRPYKQKIVTRLRFLV